MCKYTQFGSVMLVGDLNGRVNTHDLDYIALDSSKHVDLPTDYFPDNVYLNRNSRDQSATDDHGKMILDLCHSAQLRVLNGRTLGDSRGEFTCHRYNGSSVVDWWLVEHKLLSSVVFFRVENLSPMSDHCQLSMSLRVGCLPAATQQQDLQPSPVGPKWNSLFKLAYESHLQAQSTHDTADSFLISDASASELAVRLTSLLHYNNFKTTHSRHRKRRHEKKWFDKDCSQLRKHLFYLSRQLKYCKTWELPDKLKAFYSTKKRYKSLLRKKQRIFRATLVNRLYDMEKDNPKAFWDTLREIESADKSDLDFNTVVSPMDWLSHFKSLMCKNIHNSEPLEVNIADIISNDNVLDNLITEKELIGAASSLKNNKACSFDLLSNEMIKCSVPIYSSCYLKLFNSILSTGSFPDIWRNNIIVPIYKSGVADNPSNYRGIAISSCLSKLFCKILDSRLQRFLDEKNIISSCQIGFKPGFRTSDHIFTLHNIIDKFISKKRYLFACFVDLRKAFDTVWREGMLHKLNQFGIQGKFFQVIKSMYTDVMFCVKVNGHITQSFSTNIGVKQGCVLSPKLFNMFINDIPSIFDDSCDPVDIYGDKLSCLMYADDIVLLSASENGLQTSLNHLRSYLRKWKLELNTEKTQVIVFNKSGRLFNKFKLYYDNSQLAVVSEYKYLGLTIRSSGIIDYENLCKKGLKATFLMKKKLSFDEMNGQLGLKLFDSMLRPIICYGSEVWGPLAMNMHRVQPTSSLEDKYDTLKFDKFQLRFLKQLLGVNKYSTNCAVRGELGSFPVSIYIMSQAVKFWFHLLQLPKNSLAHKSLSEASSLNNNWILCIRNILSQFGFSHVWDNQATFNVDNLINALKLKMQQHYTSWWSNKTKTFSKLDFFNKFKTKFMLEKYLICRDVDRPLRCAYSRFRVSAHSLLVEVGRYGKFKKRADRCCPFCTNTVENESHFLLECSQYDTLRLKYFSAISDISTCSTIDENFILSILQCFDAELTILLMQFIHEAFLARREALKVN